MSKPFASLSRVLVVEDEAMLRDGLVRGLRSAGFAVDFAEDGLVALDKWSVQAYEVCSAQGARVPRDSLPGEAVIPRM